MCDSTSDQCGCGGVPTEPEKPAQSPPKDAPSCDADKKKKDETCDKGDAGKKSGGCCG